MAAQCVLCDGKARDDGYCSDYCRDADRDYRKRLAVGKATPMDNALEVDPSSHNVPVVRDTPAITCAHWEGCNVKLNSDSVSEFCERHRGMQPVDAPGEVPPVSADKVGAPLTTAQWMKQAYLNRGSR